MMNCSWDLINIVIWRRTRAVYSQIVFVIDKIKEYFWQPIKFFNFFSLKKDEKLIGNLWICVIFFLTFIKNVRYSLENMQIIFSFFISGKQNFLKLCHQCVSFNYISLPSFMCRHLLNLFKIPPTTYSREHQVYFLVYFFYVCHMRVTSLLFNVSHMTV